MASSVFGSERQSEIIPLKDRIDQYFPPTELLYEYPRPGLVELEIKDKLKEFKPGGNYVLTYSRFCGKFIIVPPWHPLNFEPRQTSGRDYAQTVFEGGSVEPVLDKQGQVVAGNIVLHGPRQERLKKSVAAHGFTDHINFEVFDQGTIDLISILGSDILISKDGFASRGYIRPAVGRGIGRIGVRPEKSELIVDQSVSASNLRHYLGKEAYERGEVVAVFTDQQRLTPIVAKEARNYGNGSILAERAKRFGIAVIEGDKVTYVEEKPQNPKTNLAMTGLYMFDSNVFDIIKALKPSGRGELEITDAIDNYVKKGNCKYNIIKGFWSDAGTFESLNKASNLVREKESSQADLDNS
ncbi:hypothetical protein HYT24_01630 [Candidatus Pacearchaeota archaeon]|nr:hypothetical protein [Candidatus Pacearchaeota archaeon]